MRLLFLTGVFFLMTPIVANANTQAIFKQDGSQASIVLLGMPGDSDPALFYHLLKVPEEDFNGKWSKKLSMAAPDGSKGFDVACVFSKVIQNSGTCTLIFRNAPDVLLVDKDKGRARLFLTGAAAEQFATLFVVPEELNSIYRSRDGKLQASVVREDGRVHLFVIDWNGKGI